MHDGGFAEGDKADKDTVTYCKKFAMRGYAVFSVNYRLTGGFWPNETEGDIRDAMEDFRAAIRFARKYQEEYKIDQDFIFASGASAGAVTALVMSYAQEF